MKLTNLKITPKLGILVGVTLLGLCIAGILAGFLMQREMLNARIDQTKAIVDMALNMAAGLKKEVDAGKMTKEAAIAEFGKRGNTLTYDKGAGYLFGTAYNGITVMAPKPSKKIAYFPDPNSLYTNIPYQIGARWSTTASRR